MRIIVDRSVDAGYETYVCEIVEYYPVIWRLYL